MKKQNRIKRRKQKKDYFIVRTFSVAFILLASFSVLSVGFSSWMIGLDVTVEEQLSADFSAGGVIDTASLITYYDGNYQIPEMCQDGFVVDETIIYDFEISFEFRLRIKNVQPNRGLEYYLGNEKQFVLTVNLYDRGAFEILNNSYMDTLPVTLKVKSDSESNYTNLAGAVDSTTGGRILADYTYQNNDILDINYLDFILTYHFFFGESHFGDNQYNIYTVIKGHQNNPNVDKIIALENQMFIEV